MDLERQKQAPLYKAIESFRRQRVVPFDVPGHKRGRGNKELVDFLGIKCVEIDVNSMRSYGTDETALMQQMHSVQSMLL